MDVGVSTGRRAVDRASRAGRSSDETDRPAVPSRCGQIMRITIVTETYFPQVNGVSRTLGQLVRHLTDRATRSSWSTPTTASRPRPSGWSHAVRSVVLPFYKELHLPLPPFGGVHRAIDAFRPDLVHIATEATLGLSVLRYRAAGTAPGRLELPHQLRPVQPPLPGRLGTRA